MQWVKKKGEQGMRAQKFCVRGGELCLVSSEPAIKQTNKLEVDEGAGQADIWGNAFNTEGPAPITLEWEGSLACWYAGGRAAPVRWGWRWERRGGVRGEGLEQRGYENHTGPCRPLQHLGSTLSETWNHFKHFE